MNRRRSLQYRVFSDRQIYYRALKFIICVRNAEATLAYAARRYWFIGGMKCVVSRRR